MFISVTLFKIFIGGGIIIPEITFYGSSHMLAQN